MRMIKIGIEGKAEPDADFIYASQIYVYSVVENPSKAKPTGMSWLWLEH